MHVKCLIQLIENYAFIEGISYELRNDKNV